MFMKLLMNFHLGDCSDYFLDQVDDDDKDDNDKQGKKEVKDHQEVDDVHEAFDELAPDNIYVYDEEE